VKISGKTTADKILVSIPASDTAQFSAGVAHRTSGVEVCGSSGGKTINLNDGGLPSDSEA
jgi:hypothetical protein